MAADELKGLFGSVPVFAEFSQKFGLLEFKKKWNLDEGKLKKLLEDVIKREGDIFLINLGPGAGGWCYVDLLKRAEL